LQSILTITSITIGSLKQLYWMSFMICNENNKVPLDFTINKAVAESTEIYKDNISRRAFRFGFAVCNEGMRYPNIKPSALGLKSPFAELPLPVYVQEHAIKRFAERIDDK